MSHAPLLYHKNEFQNCDKKICIKMLVMQYLLKKFIFPHLVQLHECKQNFFLSLSLKSTLTALLTD